MKMWTFNPLGQDSICWWNDSTVYMCGELGVCVSGGGMLWFYVFLSLCFCPELISSMNKDLLFYFLSSAAYILGMKTTCICHKSTTELLSLVIPQNPSLRSLLGKNYWLINICYQGKKQRCFLTKIGLKNRLLLTLRPGQKQEVFYKLC